MPAAPQQTPLPSLPETPSTSELARWQRTWIALAALASLIWFACMWPRSPVLTLVVLLLGAWSHAIVLALEFACAAWVNRADSVAAPAPAQRLGAWMQETSLTPGIFLWRQPFRWRDLPDSVLERGVVSTGPAVVLIHGFVCNRGFWAPWMRVLREAGIPFTSVNLEPVFGSIDAGISWVEGAVARAERLGTQPPILVCHSMGGLAARAWLAHGAGNRARVGRVITIGSPHHGTWLARWSRVANGRQMRQHSTWLQALADRERSAGCDAAYGQFTCFYSNADHIVFPVSTALLPGADNRHVPGAPHVALAFHPTVMRESLAMVLPGGISSEARTTS